MKQTIRIIHSGGYGMAVEADVYGQLAVHPTLIEAPNQFETDLYTVTYINTGKSLVQRLAEADAHVVARRLGQQDLTYFRRATSAEEVDARLREAGVLA